MTPIAEKIARIIAKAQSTTSAAEAESFMAKAHALLEQHGLEIEDVATLNKTDPVGTSMRAHAGYASEAWGYRLSFYVALYFGCEAVGEKVKNHHYMHAIGRESARVTYSLMMPYIIEQVRRQAKAGFEAGEFSSVSRGKTAIGNAMILRMAALVRENKASQAKRLSGAQLNALVPTDEIKAELQRQFPSLQIGKARAVKTNSAAQARAASISLHKQTKATPASHRIGA